MKVYEYDATNAKFMQYRICKLMLIYVVVEVCRILRIRAAGGGPQDDPAAQDH
jgi:hypothetical protein